MGTLVYTVVPNQKTMRQHAKAMACELRRIAKELDGRGVQLWEGTVEYAPGVREIWPEQGYRRFVPTGVTCVELRMTYVNPHRNKKAEDRAAR